MVELYIANEENTPESRINLLGRRFRELGNAAYWNPANRSSGSIVVPVNEYVPTVLMGEPEEIAYARNRLDFLANEIDLYTNDNTYRSAFWLYWRHNYGTSLMRDVITSIRWEQNPSQSGHILTTAMQGTLVIPSRGRWERTKPLLRGYDSLPRLVGSFYAPNNSTVDSRISYLELQVENNDVNKFNEFWIGIREGVSTTFTPRLNFWNGTTHNGMGSSGIATPTNTPKPFWKVAIEYLTPSVNPNDFVGRYTVLLVQQSSDLNNFYFLRTGSRYNTNNPQTLLTNRKVYPISSNQWHLLNLGEIQIGSDRGLTSSLDSFSFEIWSGRSNRTGNIQISYEAPLLLVPSSRFAYGKFDVPPLGNDPTVKLHTSPLYERYLELTTPRGEFIAGQANTKNFTVPPKGGKFVYVTQLSGVHNPTIPDLIANVRIKYYPSWRSYPNNLHLPESVNYDF